MRILEDDIQVYIRNDKSPELDLAKLDWRNKGVRESIKGQMTGDDKIARKFWTKIIVFIGVLALAGCFAISMMDVWQFNEDASDEEKNRRQGWRMTFVSIVFSLLFGTINSGVDGYAEVDSATSTALFGYLLGGTLGFIGDIMIGSDKGQRIMSNKGIGEATRYSISSLASGKFMRFQVTVLLDIFISLLIFSRLFDTILDKSTFFQQNSALANGMCSASIGMITFQAYTNNTRLLWAYPDKKSKSKETWINSTSISIATVLAAVLFMVTKTGERKWVSDNENESFFNQVVNSKGGKLGLVFITLAMITGLTYMGELDEKLESEEKSSIELEAEETLRKTKTAKLEAEVAKAVAEEEKLKAEKIKAEAVAEAVATKAKLEAVATKATPIKSEETLKADVPVLIADTALKEAESNEIAAKKVFDDAVIASNDAVIALNELLKNEAINADKIPLSALIGGIVIFVLIVCFAWFITCKSTKKEKNKKYYKYIVPAIGSAVFIAPVGILMSLTYFDEITSII
jgi:hypothetical protein